MNIATLARQPQRPRRTAVLAAAASVALAVACSPATAHAARASQSSPSPLGTSATRTEHFTPLPSGGDSWYWEIDPPKAGLAGLPATQASYPAPGSAAIWDTDLFEDSNTSSGTTLKIPTGKSPVVSALHAAGRYSVCYVESGAWQTNFPDGSDFAAADYGHGAKQYQMRGYANEWWLDIRGFDNYVAGRPATLKGAAVNIAGALSDRYGWCALEGQDAVEPDDLDGYTNASSTGAKGGGWGLNQADSAGFERWIAFTTHSDGLAVLQKNDTANARADEPLFQGVLTEECNFYRDPCAGKDGDWDTYLAAGKPVLNAEYSQDGEQTTKFCPADRSVGIWGALFGVDLSGDGTYRVCWNATNAL